MGSSVVNALSEELIATIRKDGSEYKQSYKRGKVTSDLVKVRECRGSGTSIQFTPDEEIFGEIVLDSELILKCLEILVYLNKGLKIIF